MLDTKLDDEPARQAALDSYAVLDTEPEPAFDRITHLVKTILDVPIATVSLIDRNRQWFKSCVGIDLKETSRETSFCTHAIKARTPLVIPDARLDERFARNPFVTGPPFIASYVGIPLTTPEGYNLGTLCALDMRPRRFDAGQMAILESLAALVMGEMQLRRIAEIDHLTGVFTRRAFCQEAEKAISRFVRGGSSSALLVLDVDHFKRINDTYGHPSGDVALRSVGGKLAALLRATDSAGRLGGEEFGVLLANAGLVQAISAAERYRAALETYVIDHDPPLRVTASFGVAALDEHCVSFDHWLAKADQALYAAKRGGRNQCAAA